MAEGQANRFLNDINAEQEEALYAVAAEALLRASGVRLPDDEDMLRRIAALPLDFQVDVLHALFSRVQIEDLATVLGGAWVYAQGGDAAQMSRLDLANIGKRFALWIVNKFKPLACWLHAKGLATHLTGSAASGAASSAWAGLPLGLKAAIVASAPGWSGPALLVAVAGAGIVVGAAFMDKLCEDPAPPSRPIVLYTRVRVLAAKDGAVLRQWPSVASKVVAELPAGEPVKVMYEAVPVENPFDLWWLAVNDDGSERGYISGNDVELLVEAG